MAGAGGGGGIAAGQYYGHFFIASHAAIPYTYSSEVQRTADGALHTASSSGMIAILRGKPHFVHRSRLASPVDLRELGRECQYKSNLIAERLGISRRQLERDFDATLGISPKQWLAEQRMLRALQLLRMGMGLQETAYELGFKKYDNFRVEVKRNYGLTPCGLIESCRRNMALV